MDLHLKTPITLKVTPLIALRLFLTACLGCLVPVLINVQTVLAPSIEENATSLALLQPSETQWPDPTVSPTNPPTLTATPTSTPVVVQVTD
jgi:hypothetical protein